MIQSKGPMTLQTSTRIGTSVQKRRQSTLSQIEPDGEIGLSSPLSHNWPFSQNHPISPSSQHHPASPKSQSIASPRPPQIPQILVASKPTVASLAPPVKETIHLNFPKSSTRYKTSHKTQRQNKTPLPTRPFLQQITSGDRKKQISSIYSKSPRNSPKPRYMSPEQNLQPRYAFGPTISVMSHQHKKPWLDSHETNDSKLQFS